MFAAEGRVDELQQLVSSGVVRSLKVVDSEGHHVLNIAIQHKQDKVVQVGVNSDMPAAQEALCAMKLSAPKAAGSLGKDPPSYACS